MAAARRRKRAEYRSTASPSTKLPRKLYRKLSGIRAKLTAISSMRSRHGACWTALSAGRVQTVALRLIVEREREVKAFETKEYWTIDAHLAGGKPPAFDARFIGRGDEKTEVPNEEESKKIVAALEKADWAVRNIEKKERRRSPAPPFTTSKLQQDGSRKLRFSVKRMMMIAQRLYEGVELGDEGSVGLITYMRTDSVRVSNDAVAEVRQYIDGTYGKEFLPESPNVYKSKKEAQEAHEAIRPTSVTRHPDEIKKYLGEDEYKV